MRPCQRSSGRAQLPRILWFSCLTWAAMAGGPTLVGRLVAEEAASQAAAAAPKGAARLDAHCIDGSLLKLSLRDATIPIKTDYGRIEIPVSDIERIDFATRLPLELEQQVRGAVARLGDGEFTTREAASEELLGLGAAAYRELLSASESEDPEVMQRAEKLIDRLRAAASEEELQVRDLDTITTAKSQIGGTIDLETLRVATAAFGEQQLKLTMLRSIGGDAADELVGNVQPAPSNLMAFQGQVGKTLYFKLTAPPGGAQNGYVWGTDVYTLDSSLVLAALHAGALKAGQTKVVGVVVLDNQNTFTASTRQGISSGNWNFYPGGYKFKSTKAARVGAVPKR